MLPEKGPVSEPVFPGPACSVWVLHVGKILQVQVTIRVCLLKLGQQDKEGLSTEEGTEAPTGVTPLVECPPIQGTCLEAYSFPLRAHTGGDQ